MDDLSDLSQNCFESLVEHLSSMVTNKSKIIDGYFDDSAENPREFEYLVNSYINQIQNVVEDVKMKSKQDKYVPLVIVGSEVTVEDLGSNEQFMFRIVPPFESQREKKNIFDVSCVSPVGRSLLLKKIGDIVDVEAPGGVFQYEVKSIKYP